MKKVIVIEGQTLFDIAIQEYGSLEGIRYLIEDNVGFDIDTDLMPGQVVLIRSVDALTQPERKSPLSDAVPKLALKRKEVISEGQNIFDLAVQFYGHASGVKILLEDNPGLTIDKPLKAGQIVLVRTSVIDKEVITILSKKNTQINTGPEQKLQGAFGGAFNNDFDI